MSNREETGIDLLRLIHILWRKAWAIALVAVIFGMTALFVTTAFVTPLYKSRALMYVNSSNVSVGGTKLSISQAELSAAQSLVDTYIVILNTRTTLNDVIEQTGVDYTYEQLTKMISAASINSTEVFYIEVTSSNPQEAELLANTIAQVLPEKISSVVEGSSVRIVDYAVESAKKDSPNLALNVIISVLLGIMLACGVIVVVELMDKRIHNVDYLLQVSEIPVLAVIPDLLAANSKNDNYQGTNRQSNMTRLSGMVRHKKKRRNRSVLSSTEAQKTIGENLSFAAAEAYKLLRTNLEFSLPNETGCKVIGVTSSLRGEGKSTTSINMAYSMAQTGKKVLLMEADLRLPILAKRLRISQSPGISNLLAGQCSGKKILQKTRLLPNLWVAAAGDKPPNPAELLGSEQMAITMKTLSGLFDVIILDLPPITLVSDALIVSKLVSGMIVVVREDFCDRDSLDDLVRQLRFVDCKILGFVMTDSDVQKKNYRRYGKSCGDNKQSNSESDRSTRA